jgi:hypothetical protein
MSELLNSIKADLLDRRLLPLVALVGVGLIAALAYAVLGGGSTPAAVPPSSASNATQSGGLQVSAATAERSVAETTDGAREQRSGKARDPFTVLPGTKTASTSAASSSTSTSTTSSASGTETSGKTEASGGTETSGSGKTEENTKAGKTKKPGYHVAVLFGLFPAGATPETVSLTPYENLELQAPLPSAKHPLIVFRGVTAGGKSATFTLLGEAILHGLGACLPNAVQCQAIDLKPGQTEQLEYLSPSGETTVYELRVVSITEAKAKASKASKGKASAADLGWAESKAGRELLRHSGLFALPFLRYSSRPGVLVFAPRKASAARAHVAADPLFGWR